MKQLTVSFIDQSGEVSTSTFQLGDYLNVDAAVIDPALVTFANNFLFFLSEGVGKVYTYTETRKLFNGSIGEGNREDKWLVRYEDSVTKELYTVTIPCRDNTITTLAGTDIVDPANVGYAAAVSAFEAIVLAPNGNPVNVVDIRLVGRNI